VGGSGSELQYRMTSSKAMPKFVSRKNPFRSEVRPRAMTAETGCAVVPATSTPVSAPAPQPSPAPAPSAAQPAAAPGRMRRGLTGLRERANRFFAWLLHPRPMAAKPAIPRFEPLPIQGELSLDRIKVVRNDLSDADLELVPCAPVAPAPAPAPSALKPEPLLVPATAAAPAPAAKAGAARMVWNRAGRLLGAMKT
jgi:hypothetical protein